MTRIIAHRGSSKLFPENSLAAFRYACERGADALEVDLRCSRDGVIYCFHDYHLARMTGYSGYLSRTSSKVVDKLRVESRQHVLHFERFVEEFAGQIDIVLDIKSPGIESKIIAILGRHASNHRLIYSSFNAKILMRVKALLPSAHTALIVGPIRNMKVKLDLAAYLIERLQHLRCSAVHLSKLIAKPALVRRLKQAGFHVAVWTVDDVAAAGKLAASGVDGIISNLPEALGNPANRKLIVNN